ncbi:hypothetical protein AOQ84DRAFT_395440 [Glonium stellatum]|uniref:Uncharacterized protein n=1 Tax=Glonium stellatum TaxID=574774 RepID=A0A8E2F919_9PEZI|nr:hypothetical protein AOQ84DRAFT_395440 [Glonium stellatum]
MEKIAKAVGTWDVLILNAGFISAPAPISKAPLDEYWKNYETNVKSIVILAKAFFPTANSTRAAVLAVTGGALVLPPKQVIGLSGYLCSKLAQIKTLEFLAAENLNMFFSSVHPGMIETDIFLKSAKLPAHFMVWLSQPEAQFLNGRFAKAKEIEPTTQMTIGYEGWPFPHM